MEDGGLRMATSEPPEGGTPNQAEGGGSKARIEDGKTHGEKQKFESRKQLKSKAEILKAESGNLPRKMDKAFNIQCGNLCVFALKLCYRVTA